VEVPCDNSIDTYKQKEQGSINCLSQSCKIGISSSPNVLAAEAESTNLCGNQDSRLLQVHARLYREVLTAQNLQPRVHVSPMSIIVAVAVWPSPPPQHSPMLGQRASSQTVCNFSSRSLACNKRD
jgi:hypothetical protein